MFKTLIIFCLFSSTCLAGISPQREMNQSYKEIMNSYSGVASFSKGERVRTKSATGAASSFEELNDLSLTEWASYEVMLERFEEIRDERFINPEDEFPRRISWMYPDDGCYVRAGMFIKRAREKGYEAPERVYVFGDLLVETENTFLGTVTWWYHTAAVVKVEDQVYVLDPSVEPNYPLTIENWILKQAESLSSVELSYCRADTYSPANSCTNPRPGASSTVDLDQDYFLEREWYRQLTLKRDPLEVLGDKAPWLIKE